MPANRFLPVLVMTADATPDTRHRALELGATDFLTKPVNVLEATLRIRNLLHTRRLAEAERLRAERDTASTGVEPEATRERLDLLALALSETVGQLARLAEHARRDHVEHADREEHVDRVGHIARAIAERMGIAGGYPPQLELAARLHDIGQVAVPSTVLAKAGPLTPDERALVERHCKAGHAMLRGSRSLLLQLSAEIALAHHERWDGSGYPSGLAGSAIPLSARIVAVADVVDALGRDRDDRPAWPLDEIVEHLRTGAGTLFDPDVVAHALAWLSSPEGGGHAVRPAAET
jgi:putative two-component system response regulator